MPTDGECANSHARYRRRNAWGWEVSVLFVCNYPPDTGYAWWTIEEVFRGVGGKCAEHGLRPYICHPAAISEGAATGEASVLVPVVFDYRKTRRSLLALLAFMRLVRRLRIRILYLTDQPTWSLRYPLLHVAGVRRILVQDRTSGQRTRPNKIRRLLKQGIHRIPWLAADRFVGASDFVVTRLRNVNGTPASRTVRVYNGIPIDRYSNATPHALHQLINVPKDSQIVFCAARAQPYKGIPVLIEAAVQLRHRGFDSVAFVYCGDGASLDAFRRKVRANGLRNFHFLGRRDDIADLLPSATVAVVASVWAESFGLTIVEAMLARVPVVATRTGAIPELVSHEHTGILVAPGEATELADAIQRMLSDADLRDRLARHAVVIARERFDIRNTVDALYGQVALLRDSAGV